MRQIKAFIRPAMLERVEERLRTVAGLPGIAVTHVEGYGRGRDGTRILNDWIELQVVAPTTMVDAIVAAIRDGAHTGRSGDGKIFVTEVERAIRISSGEEGEEAL